MAALNFWTFAQQHPDHTAIVEVDEHTISFGELLASANRVVHGLRALGMQQGDVMAAVLPNSAEVYELYMAMQQAGFYLIPVNFHLVGPEIAYILQDCEARAFIAHASFAQACTAAVEETGFPKNAAFAVGGEIPGFRTYEELKAGQPASLPSDRTFGAMMHYTSGTTGRPKGVRRPLPTTDVAESNLGGGLLGYGVTPEETDNVHLLACPWYHTAPLVMSAPSLHLGHKLVIMDRFNPERCLQLIDKYKVTITHLVPTQFVRLLALPEDVKRKYDVSSLRHVIHGAAPCSPDVKRRMIEWWGPVVEEYYASTEGVGGTIIKSEEWLRKPGSVGKPAGHIVIMDDEGNILGPNEIGTIYSKPRGGAGFSYFKDPAKTQAAQRGEYQTVGDVGYLDEDGYLFLSDRKADMIISGGVNIYPAELESVLVAHPKVIDVAVFGIPNEEWGEEVKAIVQPAIGVEGDDGLRDELMAYAAERVAKYKLPRTLDFMSELPRDDNGKLYKRKLRDPYWAGRERAI
ncbi:MAG: acyl-CoA synthetase [Chloroflexi bacterium]|nr:acyl-CoA synthetase [Chloroflexota bacterium]